MFPSAPSRIKILVAHSEIWRRSLLDHRGAALRSPKSLETR